MCNVTIAAIREWIASFRVATDEMYTREVDNKRRSQ